MISAEREEFEGVAGTDALASWPEVGSRMMTRLMTGRDFSVGGWITVQCDVYRYAVLVGDLMVVRSVLFEYLATEVCWTDC
jgi:hypothetical protein